MKGKDIIIVGQQPWDIEIGSNAKNIAEEFARDNRVLYVNAPLDRKTRWTNSESPAVKKRVDVINGKDEDLVQINENLWNLYPKMMAESINWIRIHGLFRWINKINNQRFAKEIQSAAKRLGFKDFVLFNDSLMFGGFHLKEILKPAKYIYYTRDYLIIQPYFKRHGVKLEGELIGKSDLVVANSTYLKEYAGKYNQESFYVGQGCEVSMFDGSVIKPVPQDMPKRNGPIIGYVGYLTGMRLDIDLLVYLAKEQPDWNLVLVGPEDEEFEKSELHNLENVHFLGAKEPDVLPDYMQQFDVCINPQIVNQLTIGNYPRKIDEYLAMGKPVIATETKAMEVFAEHVYLARNHQDYIHMIDKALHTNTPERAIARMRFAKSHTWENSVNEIYKAIQKAG